MRWSDPFDDLLVGQRFQSAERTVTEADVIGFCALTGDWHPQHCDPDWAARSPFGERIAHGMLILSLAVGLVPLDPQRVLALRRASDVVFKRPVRLGETISVEGELKALAPIAERAGLVDFSWSIRNRAGALVCRARVQVLWRRALSEVGGPADGQTDERAGTDASLDADTDTNAAFWHDAITAEIAPGEFIPVPL
jgi:3-hydroxybutyryl-CoA dehydratase